MIFVASRGALVAWWVCAALCLACLCYASTSTPYQMMTRGTNIIVWQNFDPWYMVTEDLAAGRVCYFYDYQHQSKMNLKTAQPGNWMPLGSAIKWLLFVETVNGRGRLMTHQVDYHMDFVAWPSDLSQVGCAMTGNICYFGETRATLSGDHYATDIYAQDVATGLVEPLCISDSAKSQFAHDCNLLVYKAHYGPGDDRVCGQYLAGGTEFEIARADAIEPSVCDSLVAWAQASGDGYDIVAKDISTGETRLIAHTTANPPCPEAGRRTIFWRDARNTAVSGIDLYGYDWCAGQEFPVTTAAGDENRLRACGNRVTWVTGAPGYEILWGADVRPSVRIADVRVTGIGRESVILAWTSAGGMSYDLRKRTDGPVTDANWSTATSVPGLPAPTQAGQTESFLVTSLQPGHYYFGLKVALSGGGSSALSNCVCAFLPENGGGLLANPGAYTAFSGVVTGVAPDGAIYCQSADWGPAVRIELGQGVSAPVAGTAVDAVGVMDESQTLFGPVLRESVCEIQGAGTARCAAMLNRDVGGWDARFGRVDGGGPSNLWRLVAVWGRVTGLTGQGAGCSFYLDDGSLPAGERLRVVSPFTPPAWLTDGAFATVRGIAEVTRAGSRQVEVVDRSGVRVTEQ